MKPKFEPLSVFEFGKQLVETADLDPVYVVIWESPLVRDQEKLAKWLWGYWLFYHMGTASWLVDQPNFWKALAAAAATKEHPRSSERRHFRGAQAIKAVESLRALRLTPSELISGLVDGDQPLELSTVLQRVKQHRGFGDWIAFKVADMLERLQCARILFRPDHIFEMYDSPRKGAEDMSVRHGPFQGNLYVWAYHMLCKSTELRLLLAPPRYERRLNIQEIETILCKWHSHLAGHYTVGKDIAEIKHGLERYEHTPTAKLLWQAGQKGGLW